MTQSDRLAERGIFNLRVPIPKLGACGDRNYFSLSPIRIGEKRLIVGCLSLTRVYKSASTVLHQESALFRGGDYLSRSLANPAGDEIAALADTAGAATSLAR
jgi:hypothetical protein